MNERPARCSCQKWFRDLTTVLEALSFSKWRTKSGLPVEMLIATTGQLYREAPSPITFGRLPSSDHFGANDKSEDVLSSWQPKLIRFFLENGAEHSRDSARTAVGCRLPGCCIRPEGPAANALDVEFPGVDSDVMNMNHVARRRVLRGCVPTGGFPRLFQ